MNEELRLAIATQTSARSFIGTINKSLGAPTFDFYSDYYHKASVHSTPLYVEKKLSMALSF